jgi:ABC-type branched-subunit amino acid transport system substrate-binding protein
MPRSSGIAPARRAVTLAIGWPLLAVALLWPAAARGAGTSLTLLDADYLASRGAPTSDFKRWTREASLSELMYLLRRGPESLGGNERVLVEAALKRVSDERSDLQRRLRMRLALADPRKARRMLGDVGRDPGSLLRRARASVFEVAVLLPTEGPYAAYADGVRAGVEAGIAFANARGTVPIGARFWNTGDDDPARTAAVLDSASLLSAVAIGELLSVPTLALSAGARVMRLPLISPTATDEDVGRAGDTVFQIGPSAFHRGVTLASSLVTGGIPRTGVMVSSDLEARGFDRGFAETIQAAGGEIVWRDAYAPGSRDFRAEVKRLGIEQIGLLFWDGDPEEGAALMREISRQRLDVRLCGGEALSPAQQHRSTVPLLENARYVADDWTLQPGLMAPLDSLLAEQGVREVTSLHIRGFLAAYLVAAAVQGRALCAEEMTASLATWVRGDPYLVARGFLDWSAEGAALHVYAVEKGKPRRLGTP